AALAAASSPARKPESQARCSRLDLLTMVLSAAISSRENGAKLGTRATFDIVLSAKNAIDGTGRLAFLSRQSSKESWQRLQALVSADSRCRSPRLRKAPRVKAA